MTRTRNGPGVASRPATRGTTCGQCNHTADTREYERGFCDGWAELAEYNRRTRMTWDDGVEWGWYLASRAMNNAIAEATAGMPHDAAEVVRQLVRVMRTEARDGGRRA